MKHRKSIKSLARRLATAWMALVCLSTAALAYSDPIQFSDWLLDTASGPQAAGEVLAVTGTVLG